MRKSLRRFVAFLIDLLLISLLLMIVYYFVPAKDTTEISQNITKLTEQVLNSEIGHINFLNGFSKNIYLLDSGRIILNAFSTLVIMLYFVITPIITKGYTLGLYISGIKLSGKLNIKNLLLRNMIATGLFYLLMSIILVYTTKDTLYFVLLSIFGIIQFLLVIISAFMIIYRKDHNGLQDKISKTKIVLAKEVKKWENLQSKN